MLIKIDLYNLYIIILMKQFVKIAMIESNENEHWWDDGNYKISRCIMEMRILLQMYKCHNHTMQTLGHNFLHAEYNWCAILYQFFSKPSYMNSFVFPWIIYLKTLAISIIIRNCGTNLNTTIEKESVRSSSQLFSSGVNRTTSTKAGLTILRSFCSQRLSRSHSLNPFFLSFLLISLETLMLLFFLSL